MVNGRSTNRRDVLQGLAGTVAGSAILQMSASAQSHQHPAAISIRSTAQNPITADMVHDEIRENTSRIASELGVDKTHVLTEKGHIEKQLSNKNDVVAFNLVAKDEHLSVYTGRALQISGERRISTPEESRVHGTADKHLEARQRKKVTSTSDDFELVSDYREDGSLEGIPNAEGYAQHRTYLEDWNGDSDVKVVRSRIDQRVEENEYGDCHAKIDQKDQILEHDYDEEEMALDDWSPNPQNEDEQSGSSTVSLSRAGVQYSYSYDHGSDITVIDDSPFNEETARARIKMPGKHWYTNPDRIRASNASLAKLDDDSSIVPVTWECNWKVFDYYSGRCVMQSISNNLVNYPYLS